MAGIEFIKMYWNYYLVLESDLSKIEQYVSFDQKNYKCFSNEFVKLFQAICSEFDVICREYCHFINETTSKGKININIYKSEIIKKHSEITGEKILFIPNNEWIQPLDKWESKSANWWTQYNCVKHSRTANFNERYNYESANLENVIYSLGALYIIEKYFYNDLSNNKADVKAIPLSRVLPESSLFGFLDGENDCLFISR